MLSVLAEPLRYHRKHPLVEVLLPEGIIGLHAASQFAHVVMLAVPLWQMVDIVFHRIIAGNQVRVDVAVQILVPRINPRLQRLDGHRVTGCLVEWLETIAQGVLAVFGRARHHVQAQRVVLLHVGLGLVGE